MKRSLIALSALLAVGCAPDAPDESIADTAASAPPCLTQIVQIEPGASACGLGLDEQSRLLLNGAPIGESWVVSYGEAGSPNLLARAIMVYPPALNDGVALVRGCDGPGRDALCWSQRLVNLSDGSVRELSTASRYGPREWISWSPDGARFALIEDIETEQVVTVVNAASGALVTFGPIEGVTWRIEEETFAWESAATFRVRAAECTPSDDPSAQPSCGEAEWVTGRWKTSVSAAPRD